MNIRKILVMGVSGSGKSLIGQQLGETLGLQFLDADDVHSAANIRKMADGVPLSDDDRRDWLRDLAGYISRGQGLVLACSALKRSYRDQLRKADPTLAVIYLKGDIDTIWLRHAERKDHYFTGKQMLQSQYEQLEEPNSEEATIVDIRQSPKQVLHCCLAALGSRNDV